MADYKVKAGEFEGPIDLLLGLIERRKMHISDVSLAVVTDDYLAYVKQLETLPLADSANFIYVASVLILIKSKSLLPGLETTEEEAASIEELNERLRLYKDIKTKSVMIKEVFGTKPIFFREVGREERIVFMSSDEISTGNLVNALKGLLASIPVKEKVKEALVRKVVSLEEVIINLTERVTRGLRTSFREFAGGHSHKADVVVSFLAMLELVKQGIIGVKQQGIFQDIHMETEQGAVPKYG